MADDWRDQIRNIAASLLTVEVNTIEKPNMSAAKMPDIPLALHQIAQVYLDEIESWGCTITDRLLAAAVRRLEDGKNPDTLKELQDWVFAPGEQRSANITNGPKTFEAMQWAANGANHRIRASLDALKGAERATALVSLTLMRRITTNSRQLRQLALLLQQQNQASVATTERLAQLLDGTIEDTTTALFQQPRPKLVIDTDILIVVRKVWDIGLERVMFQTTMQVDGDMLVRIAPDIDDAKRQFLGDLHRATAETAIKQWNGLFHLASTLASDVGRALFGRT